MVLLFCAILCMQTMAEVTSSAEKLLLNYDSTIPPAEFSNSEEGTEIYYDISITSVQDIDEKTSKVTLSFFEYLSWSDPRLVYQSN